MTLEQLGRTFGLPAMDERTPQGVRDYQIDFNNLAKAAADIWQMLPTGASLAGYSEASIAQMLNSTYAKVLAQSGTDRADVQMAGRAVPWNVSGLPTGVQDYTTTASPTPTGDGYAPPIPPADIPNTPAAQDHPIPPAGIPIEAWPGSGSGAAWSPDPITPPIGESGPGTRLESGTVSIGDNPAAYPWLSGGMHASSGIPPGNYNIDFATGVGPQGQSGWGGQTSPAIAGVTTNESGNNIAGPYLTAQGIEIHSLWGAPGSPTASGTLGCFGITQANWPAFSQALQSYAAENGPLTLSISNAGNGTFTAIISPKGVDSGVNPGVSFDQVANGFSAEVPYNNATAAKPSAYDLGAGFGPAAPAPSFSYSNLPYSFYTEPETNFESPSGPAIGEPPNMIRAGYSYLPGSFGEIDPFNFSSAPFPSGGFGGGSPTQEASGSVIPPFEFSQPGPYQAPGVEPTGFGFPGNAVPQVAPGYDLGAIPQAATPAPYDLGAVFPTAPAPYDLGTGFGGGFEEAPPPLPQGQAGYTYPSGTLGGPLDWMNLPNLNFLQEDEPAQLADPWAQAYGSTPPAASVPTDVQGFSAVPLGSQLAYGAQGFMQSMFAPYWNALSNSPEAQVAMEKMLSTEIGGKGYVATNQEITAAFTRMVALGIPPTAANIAAEFTKGSQIWYQAQPGADLNPAGNQYWQDPGRAYTPAMAAIDMQAARDVLSYGESLAYSPGLGLATGSGSYQYGAHPYNPLKAGPFIANTDLSNVLGTPGLEYFVQEGIPALNKWMQIFNRVAPNYVPGSPL